jgi:hypothetical protein
MPNIVQNSMPKAEMESVSRELAAHHSIQEYLRNTGHRLLYVELVDLEPEAKTDQEPQPPSRFLGQPSLFGHGVSCLSLSHFARNEHQPARSDPPTLNGAGGSSRQRSKLPPGRPLSERNKR